MKKISIILVCLFFIGIQQSRAQNVVTYDNNISTLNGEPFFVRGTYTDNNPDVDFAKVKAAGFNLVMSYYTKGGELSKIQFILDNAQANGLYALIYIGNDRIKQGLYDEISDIVNQFKSHPALYGWYLTDEPGPWYSNIPVANLQEAASRVRAEDTNHPIFGSVWALNNNDDYVSAIDVDMRQGYFGNPTDMAEDFLSGRSGLNSGYIQKIEGYNKEWLSIINSHVSPFIEPDKSGATKATYASPAMWYSSGGLNKADGDLRGEDLNAVLDNPFDKTDRFGVEFKKSINFPGSTDRIRGQIAGALAYGSNAIWSWLWADKDEPLNTRWGWYTVHNYAPTQNSYKTILSEVAKIEKTLVSTKQTDTKATSGKITYRYIKSTDGEEVVIVVNESNSDVTSTLALPGGATSKFTNLTTNKVVNLTEPVTIKAQSGLFFLGTGTGSVIAGYYQDFENTTLAQLRDDAAISGYSTAKVSLNNDNPIVGSTSLKAVADGNWNGFYQSPVLPANSTYSITFKVHTETLSSGAKLYTVFKSASGASPQQQWTEWAPTVGQTETRTLTFSTGTTEDYFLLIGGYKPGTTISIDEIIFVGPSFKGDNTVDDEVEVSYQQTFEETSLAQLASDSSGSNYNTSLVSLTSESPINGESSLKGFAAANWNGFYQSPLLPAHTEYTITFNTKATELGEGALLYSVLKSASDAVPQQQWRQWSPTVGQVETRKLTFSTGDTDDFYLLIGAYLPGTTVLIDDITFIEGTPFGSDGGQLPVALCQTITIDAPADSCSVDASVDDGSFGIKGGELLVSQSPTGPYELGSTDVILTATNTSGGLASCNAVVNVNDVTAADIDAGADIVLEATSEYGAAYALTPVAFDSCGVVVAITVEPELDVYPLGTTTVTVYAEDESGNVSSDSVDITVEDTTAPEVEFSCDVDILWPANHKLVLAATVSNVLDITDSEPMITIDVSSNQDINGKGDGNTDSDWEITELVDGLEVWLRAERAGNEGDRVYTTTVTVTDTASNSTVETCETVVPHNKGKGKRK